MMFDWALREKKQRFGKFLTFILIVGGFCPTGWQFSAKAQSSPIDDLNVAEPTSLPLSRISWVPGQTGVWIAGDAPAAYLIRATAGKQLTWQILKGNPQINAYFVDGSEIVYGGTLRAEGDIRLEIVGTNYSLYLTLE